MWILTPDERHEVLDDAFFVDKKSWTKAESCSMALKAKDVADQAIDNMMRED